MTELHWNLGWTLATLGVCWLALSCVVALAIGQILKRGKASTEPDSLEAQGHGAMPMQAFGLASNDVTTHSYEQLEEGLPAQGYGSRAASGTRLRAVQLEQDVSSPARKVS